ncbi:protein-disulfide isomerase [Streptacidiphilus sp. MAP12-33]|uniref:thioredoxin domain-containing protein n=1 Tax=Streptacidiphilus sp. MAP12-33 TaxID=3156266 RepID=UPI0035137558
MPRTSSERQRPHARDRIQSARAAEAKAARRRRQATVAGGTALVLALIGGVAFAVGHSGSDGTGGANAVASAATGPLVVPEHATDTTGIVYGKADAEHTLDVYEDPRCPFCGEVERALGAEMQRLADKGDYKIRYHIATFLDGNTPAGSTNALNALGAALNQGTAQFAALHAELYKNQPQEQDDVFADNSKLLALAAKVPGLDQAALKQAVEAGTYVPWAQQAGKAAVDSLSKAWTAAELPEESKGTPAVFLDGRRLNVLPSAQGPVTAGQFDELVAKELAR